MEVAAVAFNLADLLVLSGFVFVAAAAIQLARAERGRLTATVRLAS
jgi:hypothetical protein